MASNEVNQIKARGNAAIQVGNNYSYSADGLSIEDRCLQSLHVTNPEHDKARIEYSKGGLLDGAFRWILNNEEFQSWRDSEENRLLWVRGDPGKGKTMLLCGVINELEKSPDNSVAYFFCQATDTRINSATAVLRGLISMLVSRHQHLIRHVVNQYKRMGEHLFTDPNVKEAMKDVLTNILRDLDSNDVFLVIDALDECVDDLPWLLDFISHADILSRAKWIVSSRNWPNIEGALGDTKHQLRLELNEASVSAAVDFYIHYKVDDLARKKGYDFGTRSAVETYLVSNAKGTFLWVSLVCLRLGDFNVFNWNTLETLHKFPAGLDSVYERMMEQIYTHPSPHRCKQILATLLVAFRPLTLTELDDLLGSRHDLATLRGAIKSCGSFLSLQDDIVYFVHQSAKEFLLDQAVDQIFESSVKNEHYKVFSWSLDRLSSMLRRNIYGLDTLGASIDDIVPPIPDPLAALRYPCVYWIDHLLDAMPGTVAAGAEALQDGGKIQKFLELKFLFWLEALGLLRNLPEGVNAMHKLESFIKLTPPAPVLREEIPRHTPKKIWSISFWNRLRELNSRTRVDSPPPKPPVENDGTRQQPGQDLASLVQDAQRFVLYNKETISMAPLQVYASALLFSPVHSKMRQLFEAKELEGIQLKPNVELDWNVCLQTLHGHENFVRAVAFSPDGRYLASAGYDLSIRIWDVGTWACAQILSFQQGVISSLAFSRDGKHLASGSWDVTICVWDVASWTCVHVLREHESFITSVAFSPDGSLASASADCTVRIWCTATGACTQVLRGHSRKVTSVSFSPDGKRLASMSDGGSVRIWDMTALDNVQAFVHSFSPWEEFSPLPIDFSPDGKSLVFLSDDYTIKIWDAATILCTQTLSGHDGYVLALAFSPNGKYLASASETVKVWDVVSGMCIQTITDHKNTVTSVAFSPDGKYLVSASRDCSVKVWDVATMVYAQTSYGHRKKVTSVVFSPDGRYLASASVDFNVKIWDVATGLCTRTLCNHNHLVQSVAFSAGGKLLATASSDCTVKIWSVAAGVCTKTLRGHNHCVQSVAFSTDGKYLASASTDFTVKIWDADAGVCTRTLHYLVELHIVAFDADYLLASEGRFQILKDSPLLREIRRGAGDVPGKETLPAVFGNSYGFGYGMDAERKWITHNCRKILLVPPEYDATAFSVFGQTISIGCRSGRVLTIGFSNP